MKAVVYDAPRHFQVLDIPVPEPGPGEVRIGIELAGVCGTDKHIHDGDFFARFPLTPGHEPVGVVDAVGEGVIDIRPGQRVTANGIGSCGLCDYCRRGEPLRCRNLTALGVTGPGAFAEQMLVPASGAYVVDDLAPQVAVFSEPAACAMHGMAMLAMRPGSSALLFGAGPTGLILAQLMAHGGATHVTIAAPSEFKLELARSFGIDETIVVSREDPVAAAAAIRSLHPDGFDVVVDATGSANVSEQCIGLTRDGGTVLVYGVTAPSDRISVSPYEIYRREITVKGSFAQSHSFAPAISALRTGRVRTEGIINRRFALTEWGQALEALRSDAAAHKVVIQP
jgi:D-arabinitol dehydrogenase (NADP+)